MDVSTKLFGTYFATHHGLVRTRELLAFGYDDERIRMAHNYRLLVRVRQGWWALPGTAEILLLAWRAGGRLACVSALAFHGMSLELGDRLHIEVSAGSHGALKPGMCVHWSTSQANGDRRAVSLEVALRQASRCRVTTTAPRR